MNLEHVEVITKPLTNAKSYCLRQVYLLIELLIECCLTSSGKYFMHIQDESILMNDDDEPCFVLDRHAEPDF